MPHVAIAVHRITPFDTTIVLLGPRGASVFTLNAWLVGLDGSTSTIHITDYQQTSTELYLIQSNGERFLLLGFLRRCNRWLHVYNTHQRLLRLSLQFSGDIRR